MTTLLRPILRPMVPADLDAVLAVQASCYPPPMQEAADVILARLRASPETVWVAADAAGVCAYLFAYPSMLGRVTPLGGAFAVPDAPDTLYLHDLAVAPRAAGAGLARRLVEELLAAARLDGRRHSALVAVQGSAAFWSAFGYAPHAGAVDATVMATYPPGAAYLSRSL
jgi:predicted N-acetyltransferase YhbS